MPVTLDNHIITTPTVPGGSPATVTQAFTVGSGAANRLLLVAIAVFGTATITSCSYAGIAMTAEASLVANVSGNSARGLFVFKLVAPATGANNISFVESLSQVCGCMAISFAGVDQSTPLGTKATSTTSATSASGSVTDAQGGVVYSAVDARSSGSLSATGTSQTAETLLFNTNVLMGHSWQQGLSGSVTASWSWNTAADNNSFYAVPVNPAVVPGSLVPDNRLVRRNSLLRR